MNNALMPTQPSNLQVNHVVLDPARIADMTAQYAESPDPEGAAKRALVMRELLRQRAHALGLPVSDDGTDADSDDIVLEQLLAREAGAPEPTEAECRRYYDGHPNEFRPGDLAEARHILFAVTQGVPLNALRAKAEAVLGELLKEPTRFAERAAEYSNCPSGQVGGSLGQVGRDDCVAEFAEALFAEGAAGVLPRLVRTRFGFHIVLVGRRIDGRRLPFEVARPMIAERLIGQVRLKAAQQYVRLLAGAAQIDGVEFEASTSPLVQ